MTSELIPCHINADFAWMLINSYSGGVNEWEIGALCVDQESADSLKVKVEAALDRAGGLNIRLMLTDKEAMMMACSGQNCQTEHLPAKQQAWLEEWHKRWKAWVTYPRAKIPRPLSQPQTFDAL